MNRISLLFLALMPFLFASCQSTGGFDGTWSETRVKASSESVLWQVTRMALEREKFPIQGGFDPGTNMAQSGWLPNLQPFRGEGYRERAQVRFERAGDGEFDLFVRVERQNNNSIARPLDISYAEWVDAEDNEARARIVMQYIRSFLGTDDFEVTKPRDPLENFEAVKR